MNRILTRRLACGFRRPQPRPDALLPHSVPGIFSNYCDYGRPHLFARPEGKGPSIDATFRSMLGSECEDWDTILDHCNGLLLYQNSRCDGKTYVCNPSTRRWALLPPSRPQEPGSGCTEHYLAFDPWVSLHYKVFKVPGLPEGRTPTRCNEWPPLHHKTSRKCC